MTIDSPYSYILENCKVLLIGYPIAHSLSPLLHNSVFRKLELNWNYEKVETNSLNVALSALATPGVVGASVTMPLKISVMLFLDEVTPACQAIGQYRLCWNSRSHQSATMKDGDFMTTLGNRPNLIIGGGGSTRSAVYALHTWLNAGPIYLLNRCPKEADEVIAHFSTLDIEIKAVGLRQPAAELPIFSYIVGCIPDLQPVTEAEKAVRHQTEEILARRENSSYLLDMCYQPRWTSLLRAGARHGWTTIGGIEVLIHQGFQQDAKWTGLSHSKISHSETAGIIRDAQNFSTASTRL